MITHIGTAMLYVSDREESLSFYRDLLGFSVVTDHDMAGGARWLEVAPPDGSTTSTLHNPAVGGQQPGEGACLKFDCNEVAATADALRRRGTEVTDPDDQPWEALRSSGVPSGIA